MVSDQRFDLDFQLHPSDPTQDGLHKWASQGSDDDSFNIGKLLSFASQSTSKFTPRTAATTSSSSRSSHRRGGSAPVNNNYSTLASHAPQSMRRNYKTKTSRLASAASIPAAPEHFSVPASFDPTAVAPDFSGPSVGFSLNDSSDLIYPPAGWALNPPQRPGSTVGSTVSGGCHSSPSLGGDLAFPGMPGLSSSVTTSPMLPTFFPPAYCSPASAVLSDPNTASPTTPQISAPSQLFDPCVSATAGCGEPASWMAGQEHLKPSEQFMRAANDILSSSPTGAWPEGSISPAASCLTVPSPDHRIGQSSFGHDPSATPAEWLTDPAFCGVGTLFNDSHLSSPFRADSVLDSIAFADAPLGGFSAEDWLSPTLSPAPVPNPATTAAAHRRDPSQTDSFHSFTFPVDPNKTPTFEPWSVMSVIDSSAPPTPGSQISYPLSEHQDWAVPPMVPIKSEFGPSDPIVPPSQYRTKVQSGRKRTSETGRRSRSESAATWPCPIQSCGSGTLSEVDYAYHLDTVHGTSPAELSQFMIYHGIDSESIRRRNADPNRGPRKCGYPKRDAPEEVCEATFLRPYDHTRHLRTVHAVKARPWACKKCSPPTQFSREDAFRRHLTQAHQDGAVLDDPTTAVGGGHNRHRSSVS